VELRVHGQSTVREPGAGSNHRQDAGYVPERGRRVGQEEAAVRIEDSEAPRRDHHQPGHGKQNAHKRDGKLAARLVEAFRDQSRDRRRQRDPEQRENPDASSSSPRIAPARARAARLSGRSASVA